MSKRIQPFQPLPSVPLSSVSSSSKQNSYSRRTVLTKPAIVKLLELLLEERPEPTTELKFSNPFELLIAVILSAQATDVSVNKATLRLFQDAPTPEEMYKLGVEGLIPYIQTIGLFRSKAKHVIATCEKLISDFESEVPQTRVELESLPGVGRKTANVVLNTVFGHHTIAVDTHVFRVANRTGLAPGKTVEEVETTLMERVPVEYRQNAHHSLILHGRYTCQARKPKCDVCVVSDICLRIGVA
jgi:endonuclease-3